MHFHRTVPRTTGNSNWKQYGMRTHTVWFGSWQSDMPKLQSYYSSLSPFPTPPIGAITFLPFFEQNDLVSRSTVYKCPKLIISSISVGFPLTHRLSHKYR